MESLAPLFLTEIPCYILWRESDLLKDAEAWDCWDQNNSHRRQCKMSSSKKYWPVKGLGGRCLSEFSDLRWPISCVRSVMFVFSTQVCDLWFTLLPLSPSLWFNSPPLHCVNKYTIYMHNTVCKGEGGYTYILYLTRFWTYKITRPSQTET